MGNLDKVLEHTDSKEQALIEAIIEAGETLMAYWPGNTSEKDLKVQQKADGSQVTEADFSSNEILLKALGEIYPEDQICSEEVEFVRDENIERTWFVDPLDGTANFINGEDDFLILIGLCENGRPITGFAYFPVRKELCFAAKGRGAYSSLHGKFNVNNESDLNPAKINVRDFQIANQEFTNQYHTGAAQHLISLGQLQACAYKIGDNKSPKSWDFVPFDIIITESGGMISNQAGQAIEYHGDEFEARYYIASNAAIHQEFLGLINA